LPGRPHGITILDDQRVLVVARRPGDWLGVFDVGTAKLNTFWCEGESSLNGHAVVVPGTQPNGPPTVWTTETDKLTGNGLVVQRDFRTLEVLTRYSSGGTDPHELLLVPTVGAGQSAPIRAMALLVANGGLQTSSLTGRVVAEAEQVRSTLVLIHPNTGTCSRSGGCPTRF
ncbi:MAG: DUF1513 domain-containing protein, partial [Limnobacter sp.]|nr:DUF1513 domain-containing protein [Limnobacter sp.]